MTVDDADRLDDVAGLVATDASDMLRAVATSAAQVRASLTAVRETDLSRLAPDERPRAVVVTGMGGSGISGDVLAAAVGLGCPVPVVVHRGYGLPGWVGGADLTIAVSCSGTTQETLSAATEAARRGSRLAGIGTTGSPLEQICAQARGVFVPITRELSPRSSLWALSVPALVITSRLGLLDLGRDEADLELAASRLETVAENRRPNRHSFSNPAKRLATELAGTLPMIWGNGQVGAVAATRAAAQLAENAKQPAIAGGLPEVHHNQVVCFDGDLAGDPSGADLFRDRVDELDPIRLRLVLLRDDADDPAAEARATGSERLADDRGIAVSAIAAEGVPAVERLASLIGIIDYASVYLGLMRGIDPTPIAAIDELKLRLR